MALLHSPENDRVEGPKEKASSSLASARFPGMSPRSDREDGMVRGFGEHEGREVLEATIRSAAGAEAKIITYGAVVRDLLVPRPGGMQRVVNGLDTLEDYVRHSPHFGAIAGRYANRIHGGRFSVDGENYQLP